MMVIVNFVVFFFTFKMWLFLLSIGIISFLYFLIKTIKLDKKSNEIYNQYGDCSKLWNVEEMSNFTFYCTFMSILIISCTVVGLIITC